MGSSRVEGAARRLQGLALGGWLAATLVASAGAGCTGLIGGPPERSSDPSASDPTDPCSEQSPPLRRLNHTEYHHTVRDLLAPYAPTDVDVSPDPRRSGFTNNVEFLNPSALLVREYYDNAARIAGDAAPAIASALGCSTSACFGGWVREFGRRAYRRPLTDEEVARYVSFFEEGPTANDVELAVEMALMAMLQSSDFIYRPELGQEGHLNPFEIASRLSYFIWQSMPDDDLLDAAERGELEGDQLGAQIDRMLAHERAREGLLTAASEWLEVERIAEEVKGEGFPWNEDIIASLEASLEAYVWERGFAEGASFSDLLTSRGTFVDANLAPIVGVEDASSELTWRELSDRPGLLAQPAILAGQAHGTYPSPVLRGVFILNELLCDPPAPPPPDAAMDPPPLTNGDGEPISNREGYEVLTASEPGCAYCHERINPLGYGLESFDAVGRWQDEDAGGPIDTSGETAGFRGEETLSFDGAAELASQLAESVHVRRCMVSKWVRYASGSGPLAEDTCFISEVLDTVADDGAGLRDLVVAIALHPKFSRAAMTDVAEENP